MKQLSGYINNWHAEALYIDDSWGMVQFENIKLAFVIKKQHPPHLAFAVDELIGGKMHRDGSRSMYRSDPWGNMLEIIKYPEEAKEGTS